MRLPGISYRGGPQSLGRESYAGARAAGGGLQAAAMVMQVSGAVIGKFAADYHARETQMGIEEATLQMAEADARFEKTMASKNTFKADEVPDTVDVQRTREGFDEDYNVIEVNRQAIPKYEVKAGMYKDHMDKAIETAAISIPDNTARRSWIAKNRIGVTEGYGRLVASSAAEQMKDQQVRRRAKVTRAMKVGKFEEAHYVVSNMNVTVEEKAEFHDEVYRAEEVAGYEGHHMREDIPSMLKDIAFLTLPDEDYYGNGGKLDAVQRDTTVTSLKGAINTVKNKKSGSATVQKNMLKTHFSELNAQAEDGVYVKPEVLSGLIKEAEQYPDMVDDVYKAAITQKSQNVFREQFSRSDPATWLARAREFQEQAAAEGNLPAMAIARRVNDMAIKNEQLYRTDSIKFTENWGLTPRTAITPQNLKENGRERKAVGDAIASTENGYGYLSGYLKNSEVPAFVSAVNNNSMDKNMTLARDIHLTFGDQSPAVFEQLKLQGAADSFMVAGEQIAKNRESVGLLVMEGAELTKQNPKFLSTQSEDMERDLTTAFGTYTSSNPRRKEAYKTAIKNVYHKLMDVQGGGSEYNQDVFEQASELVLKDQFEPYKGYTVELPGGWTADKFNNWINNTHRSYMNGRWDPTGWNSENLMIKVHSGDIRMVGIANNKYLLYDPNKMKFVFDNNTRAPLEFYLDDQASTIDEVRSGGPKVPGGLFMGYGKGNPTAIQQLEQIRDRGRQDANSSAIPQF